MNLSIVLGRYGTGQGATTALPSHAAKLAMWLARLDSRSMYSAFSVRLPNVLSLESPAEGAARPLLQVAVGAFSGWLVGKRIRETQLETLLWCRSHSRLSSYM